MSAIITTLGMFQFVRMTWGLKNAGQCLQRNIHLILKDVPNVYIYMDDMVVASKTPAEHLDVLEKIFQRLAEYNVLVSPKKCEFAKSSVKFLGYFVDKTGVQIPKDRIDVIKNYPKPLNRKQLGRFLGIYASVHQFLPQASGILAPLHRLRSLRTEKQFTSAWTRCHDDAFQKAKDYIVKAVLLVHPDQDSATEIWCDASQDSV